MECHNQRVARSRRLDEKKRHAKAKLEEEQRREQTKEQLLSGIAVETSSIGSSSLQNVTMTGQDASAKDASSKVDRVVSVADPQPTPSSTGPIASTIVGGPGRNQPNSAPVESTFHDHEFTNLLLWLSGDPNIPPLTLKDPAGRRNSMHTPANVAPTLSTTQAVSEHPVVSVPTPNMPPSSQGVHSQNTPVLSGEDPSEVDEDPILLDHSNLPVEGRTVPSSRAWNPDSWIVESYFRDENDMGDYEGSDTSYPSREATPAKQEEEAASAAAVRQASIDSRTSTKAVPSASVPLSTRHSPSEVSDFGRQLQRIPSLGKIRQGSREWSLPHEGYSEQGGSISRSAVSESSGEQLLKALLSPYPSGLVNTQLSSYSSNPPVMESGPENSPQTLGLSPIMHPSDANSEENDGILDLSDSVRLLSRNPIAVKVVRAAGSLKATRRKFRREASVWSRLSHPNILPFYGVCMDDEFGAFGALVSPWCKNGSSAEFVPRIEDPARRFQL
ncbi:hypothetical protein FRC17_004174, partial [Serendipita sp. 399]